MAYKVIGPRKVLGAATGELVDLSSMAYDAVRALVLAGHVAEVVPQEKEETPAEPAPAAKSDAKASK